MLNFFWFNQLSSTEISFEITKDHDVPHQLIANMLSELRHKDGDGLVIGGDANSRHRGWGSSENECRGERETLFENVLITSLSICNIGNTNDLHISLWREF